MEKLHSETSTVRLMANAARAKSDFMKSFLGTRSFQRSLWLSSYLFQCNHLLYPLSLTMDPSVAQEPTAFICGTGQSAIPQTPFDEKDALLGTVTDDLSPMARDPLPAATTILDLHDVLKTGQGDRFAYFGQAEDGPGVERNTARSGRAVLLSTEAEATLHDEPHVEAASLVSREQPSVSSPSSADDGEADTTTPLTSAPPSECGHNEQLANISASSKSAITNVSELFAENILAKGFRTAQTAVGALPFAFPEIVPQDASSDGAYNLREADFWTCGFFPGTLYLLLERLIKFPQSVRLGDTSIRRQDLLGQLTTLCRTWSEPIRGMDTRTDTHDIGFIMMPALRLDWELFGNQQSLHSIVRGAQSLATRYVPSARAIRSWDLLKKKDIEILDQTENMIVIIDSMCNLDLLYYAAHHTQDPTLAEMATAHALTLLQSHLRPEPVLSSSEDAYGGQWYSTCHVANIDPKTGGLKRRLSAQGYAHESTWSRGQAWGILGYAQTYAWTKDQRFLEASCGLAEYFLYRLDTAPACVRDKCRYVPLWDFDAPIEDKQNPLWDSSAGMIAANGMLVISQALAGLNQPVLSSRYRHAALLLVQDALGFALAPEKAHLISAPYQQIRAVEQHSGVRFDGMLKFGTANNNAQARKRYANHGLVYGDYYLIEFGNRLLRMGLY